MRLSVLPLILLAMPFVEIAGFVVVGERIGVLPTLGLVIATGVLGAFLMRLQGFGVMNRIRAELEDGRDPGRELAHGVMILLAGVLLLIPGFVTDIVGVLLFLPPLRDLAWRFLRSRVVVRSGGFGGFSARGPAPRGKTIDLDEDEYSAKRDDDSPWRRIDRD
ncbi:MAG: membrane protein FxsA [Alphaproteobacteria bacterium]|nr:membrane protein FxsA [Alphaproteobacteria bacterium]